MSTEQNKEIVRSFSERFSATDVEGALDLLDDTVVWQAMGREGSLPMSGEMDKEAVGHLIQMVKGLIPVGLKLTPLGWTAEVDRVAFEMESYDELTIGKVYNNLF